MADRPLSVREHMVLQLLARAYRHPDLYTAPAADELEMSLTRFFQVVDALVDRPAAEAAYPVVVHRQKRIRARLRHARRSAVA